MAAQDDDIEAWLRKLQGKDGQPTDAEARALRQAIAARAAEIDKEVGQGDDHAWQQLRFRLRREGLVQGGRPAWARWVPAAAVATLAFGFGLAVLWPQGDADIAFSPDAPPVLRGAPMAPPIAVADPQRSARRAAAIVGAEARPAAWFHQERATLDFEIDAARVAQTQKELQREWLAVTIQPGYNRLVFTRK